MLRWGIGMLRWGSTGIGTELTDSVLSGGAEAVEYVLGGGAVVCVCVA